MALPDLRRSPEGCEMQFATNFLGHFALTLGLRPHLAQAGSARVALDRANAERLWGMALDLTGRRE
jgi:NAD(P)-dependent dehydrogenase (short-subunit alcohol dehydrogenase family)